MDQLLAALQTGAGILWKALWALIFGYLISAGIQVLVTREQMGKALGERGPKQAAMASFFGFIGSPARKPCPSGRGGIAALGLSLQDA